MGEAKRRKLQDPNYGKAAHPFEELVCWMLKGEGLMLIPDEPIGTNREPFFRALFAQMGEDTELAPVAAAVKIATSENLTKAGVRRWHEIGPGLMGLLDKNLYEKLTGCKTQPHESIVFNWYKTSEVSKMPFCKGISSVIIELINRSEENGLYPCLFQGIPVLIGQNHIRITALFLADKTRPSDCPALLTQENFT
jgi:hypothetical protein